MCLKEVLPDPGTFKNEDPKKGQYVSMNRHANV